MARQSFKPSKYLDITGEETRHIIKLIDKGTPIAPIMTLRAAAVPEPLQMARSVRDTKVLPRQEVKKLTDIQIIVDYNFLPTLTVELERLILHFNRTFLIALQM